MQAQVIDFHPALAHRSVGGARRAHRALRHWLRQDTRWFDALLRCGDEPGDKRCFMQLANVGGCEAWLVGWPPGSRAPLHDHGLAAGAAVTLRGRLSESLRLRGVWSRRDWLPLECVELAVGVCHEVHNPAATRALSLHVYAPRLERMTFYERTESGVLRPTRIEGAEQW